MIKYLKKPMPITAEQEKAIKRVAHKPMTEQEWLQTCDTEQLAEWLFRFRHNYRHTLSDADKMEIEDIEWWLKQPHTTTKE